MTSLHNKSVQLFGYMRIIAFSVMGALILFATLKGHAIAPHAPDVALDVKIEQDRKSAERKREQKAYDKVERHKENKKAPKPSKREQRDASKHKVKNLHKR